MRTAAPASLAESRLEKLKRLRELQERVKRQQDVADGFIKRPWTEVARPEQIAPPGDWLVWCILAGRGWGKSRTATEWAAMKARRYPGARIALVAKTFADARDTVLEGESGLLACFNRNEFYNGTEDDGYNRSRLQVRLANGSIFRCFSAEKPWRLRGPQHHFALADEACFWKDAHKGLIADTTWSNLMITLRLPKKPEWDEDYIPQVVIATTPRPVALLRTSDPDPSRVGILQRPTTVITRGRTVDNLANLSKSYQDNVINPLLGTRLGRQELDAEILDDIPGALWKREWIEETRITDDSLVPDLIRVVVGVDPAVTDGEASAQTGIIVAGAAKNGHGYVLADYTLRATPKEAMQKVVQAYHDFKADRVVAEVNNGGDFIGTLLKTVDPNIPYQSVRATRGKQIRAEPVSSLYEMRRIHHVNSFPYLEDSMCSWTPTDAESPDRLDACLIAGTQILTERGNVNIEDVIPGERVWTRQGWQPVLASRCTQREADVMTVVMSNGRKLTGTPDHRVWVNDRGWMRLDALVYGDILTAWIHQATSTRWPSNSTAQCTGEIQNRHIASTVSTTSKMHQAGHSRECCIETYGRFSTSVISHQDITSTTLTSTHSIISQGTCKCSHHQSMQRRMLKIQSGMHGYCSWQPSDENTQQNGIEAKRVVSGIVSTPSVSGDLTGSQRALSACDVASYSVLKHISALMDGDFVRQNAEASFTQKSISIKSSFHVQSVASCTGIQSIQEREAKHQHAHERVHTVTEEDSAASSSRAQSAVMTSPSVSKKIMEHERVHGNAHTYFAGTLEEKKSHALSVVMNTNGSSVSEKTAVPVRVSVAGIFVDKKRQPVYDLMVSTAHEFLANGMIVHNCVWSITALRDLLGGSFLAAYGVIKCEKCNHPFTQNDPSTKQPRLACPKCGAPVIIDNG